MKLIYPAVFYPCEEKEGYTVVVPDLPGCVSEGDSLIDAILMGSDAASGWVLDELEDGRKAPKATPLDKIVPEKGGFTNLLILDMDSYAEKYGNKAVRKNITIPAYMNTYVERNEISLSRITQDAISERMQG
ncbi:MAG: type II toxin-antitoxin system HicB family antitoxin [Eubacterium sp.]|nr:type II toxin-antitoxin system HicB family antitoxin [Eubacterium sp.]